MTRSRHRAAFSLLIGAAIAASRAAGADPPPAPSATDADPHLIVHSAQHAPAAVAAQETSMLRFLHTHRAFLLTRLSAHAGPGAPDPRLEHWLDEKMLAAVAGLGAADGAMARGGLSAATDWPEIEVLAATLDSLTARMAGIDARLTTIRSDFAHNQATELLVALAAPPDQAGDIESAQLHWNRQAFPLTDLPAADRTALAAGGYRPLQRAFCRPEAQELLVDITLAGGRTLTGQIAVSPEKNRLTVVVFGVATTGVQARVWTL